jgi:hypothetical protein
MKFDAVGLQKKYARRILFFLVSLQYSSYFILYMMFKININFLNKWLFEQKWMAWNIDHLGSKNNV